MLCVDMEATFRLGWNQMIRNFYEITQYRRLRAGKYVDCANSPPGKGAGALNAPLQVFLRLIGMIRL